MEHDNKMNVYIYRSPIGDFAIKYIPASEKWLLSVNDTGYGFFQSPEEAAENVFKQNSGYYKWDELIPARIPGEIPGDLTHWEVIKR